MLMCSLLIILTLRSTRRSTAQYHSVAFAGADHADVVRHRGHQFRVVDHPVLPFVVREAQLSVLVTPKTPQVAVSRHQKTVVRGSRRPHEA